MRMLVSATVRQPPCRTCASVRRYGLHSSAKSGVCSSQVATQFHNSWVYGTAIPVWLSHSSSSRDQQRHACRSEFSCTPGRTRDRGGPGYGLADDVWCRRVRAPCSCPLVLQRRQPPVLLRVAVKLSSRV